MRVSFGLVLAALVGACGSVVADGPAPEGGALDAGPTDDAAFRDATGDVADDARRDAPAVDSGACADVVQALSAEYGGVKSCTTTVRLSYTSLELLGFSVACGPYAGSTEASAATASQAATGFGAGARQIAGAQPTDEWLFVQDPGDFGGVGAVAVRTGLAVFGGSVVWNGAGDLTYPASWRPASELGVGCGVATAVHLPPLRAFALEGETLPAPPAAEQALATVWATAVPDALGPVSYVFDAVALAYPRTVGAFDPSTAEWIVMVNSGWLE